MLLAGRLGTLRSHAHVRHSQPPSDSAIHFVVSVECLACPQISSTKQSKRNAQVVRTVNGNKAQYEARVKIIILTFVYGEQLTCRGSVHRLELKLKDPDLSP